MSVNDTLNERGKRYGTFNRHSKISQALQTAMFSTAGWSSLTDDKKEALQLIQHKIARILNGDPEYKDNWHDIQGYAKLSEDLCIAPPVKSIDSGCC